MPSSCVLSCVLRTLLFVAALSAALPAPGTRRVWAAPPAPDTCRDRAAPFEQFKADYRRVYPTDCEEDIRRYVFGQTVEEIRALNARNPAAPHGINEFSDMTDAEYVRLWAPRLERPEPKMSGAPGSRP